MNSRTDVLPTSLQFIKNKLALQKDLSPAEIRQIVLEAKVKADDLMPWSDFDHPAADSYGRQLIHHGGHFEMMVMSWKPGDFSAIHDHGYTEWGAVQVFGPAEHATFRFRDNKITTLARWAFEPGDVVGVSHNLIHQMGNPTNDEQFLTLHVYGKDEELEAITGDARIFDLDNEAIQRADGGVFFALPTAQIKRVEKGLKADFSTRLRHMLELTKRLLTIEQTNKTSTKQDLNNIIQRTFCLEHLENFLAESTDHVIGKTFMKELKEASKLQDKLTDAGFECDHFKAYTNLYATAEERFSVLAD